MKERMKTILYKIFRQNLLLKIVSVLFAIILWNYVIVETNPLREKTFSEVPVKIQGEAELRERGLAIREDLTKLVASGKVTVNVRNDLFNDLTRERISLNLDLSTVTSVGEQKVNLTCTTSYGTVKAVTPGEVTVTVEELVTRTVPVRLRQIGTLQSNYWIRTITAEPEQIVLTGAKSDLETVEEALVDVDITSVTETREKSLTYELKDAGGDTISAASIRSDVSAVKVNIEAYSTKELPINKDSLTVGEVAQGYEITDVAVLPETLVVAGPKTVLDGMESLQLEQVNVAGLNQSVNQSCGVEIPDGVMLMDAAPINVAITIEEKREEITYDMPVNVENLQSGLTAKAVPASTEVTFTVPYSMVNRIRPSYIRLYVDVAHLGAGSSTVPVKWYIADDVDIQDIRVKTEKVEVIVE